MESNTNTQKTLNELEVVKTSVILTKKINASGNQLLQADLVEYLNRYPNRYMDS